jgi:hypothetical protein
LADILEISTQVVGHIPHRVLVIAGTRRLGTRNLLGFSLDRYCVIVES